jgi:hypothetical protein
MPFTYEGKGWDVTRVLKRLSSRTSPAQDALKSTDTKDLLELGRNRLPEGCRELRHGGHLAVAQACDVDVDVHRGGCRPKLQSVKEITGEMTRTMALLGLWLGEEGYPARMADRQGIRTTEEKKDSCRYIPIYDHKRSKNQQIWWPRCRNCTEQTKIMGWIRVSHPTLDRPPG